MSSIFDSKNPLIVLGSDLKPGDYIAFTVLLDVLRKNATSVELMQLGKLSPNLANIVRLPEVKIVESIAPRKFVLSFDRGEDNVKNIQWHQTDNKINIYVSMDNGQFKTDGMKLNSEGANYDAIIYYGVTDFQPVQAKLTNHPSLVSEVTNISFGSTFAIPHSKVELVRPEQNETLSELVYASCQGKGMTPEHYSRLLAGILSSTKRFTLPNTRAKTFTTCAELIANGAEIARANSLIDRGGSTGSNPTQPAAAPSSSNQPGGSKPANSQQSSSTKDPLPQAKPESEVKSTENTAKPAAPQQPKVNQNEQSSNQA